MEMQGSLNMLTKLLMRLTLACNHLRIALSQSLRQWQMLEKQAHKNKDKLIANRRRQRQNSPPPIQGSVQEPEVPESNSAVRVVSSGKVVSKPLTLQEAQIVLEQKDRDQVTYRDVESGQICVLLRRRDGHLELVETTA